MEEFPQLLNPHDDSVINITNSSFSIGRSLSCDHIIQSLNVSRFHCIIKKTNDKWTLYDRSSNGTVINSKLYHFNESVDLKHGDMIKLGPDNLEFVFNLEKKNSEPVSTATSDETAMLEPAELEEFQQPFEIEVETSTATQSEQNKVNNSEENVSLPEQEQTPNPDVKPDIMENELTCSICSELFIKAVTLNCSHTYCKFCIEEWKKNKSNCPICRQPIKTVSTTLVLDNFIEKFIDTQSEEVKATRQSLIEQRNNIIGNTASSSNATINNQEEVIQILSDNEEEDDNSDYSDYSDDEMYEDYDCDFDSEPYVRSRGNYYGGYGRCFICNQTGHWANSCPFKRR